jgi:4-hydroxy-tetrahydrodipicolinate reductase
MKPTLVIHGAAGRVGRRILALAVEEQVFQIAGAVDHPAHPELGKDVGVLAGVAPIGVNLDKSFPQKASVVIDFSLPQAAAETISWAEKSGTALVMGTTGLDNTHMDLLKNAARKIAIVQATNMSLGMNLLFSIVGKVAEALGANYDIEITEAHHRFKKDAPAVLLCHWPRVSARPQAGTSRAVWSMVVKAKKPCVRAAPSACTPFAQATSLASIQ